MQNDWWGEPLGAMLSRVLIEELSQRLPQSAVHQREWRGFVPADATIELNIRRLDEDAAGNLVLQAQAAVSFKGRPARAAELSLRGAAEGARRAGRGRSDQRRGRTTRRWARLDVLAGSPRMKRRSVSPSGSPATQPQLRECPGCGLFQMIPAWPGTTAQCARCPTTLHRATAHPLDHSIALTVAALVLLLIMCTTTLMNVRRPASGIAPICFRGRWSWFGGMAALAAVVVFVTVVAPFGKLIGTLYV